MENCHDSCNIIRSNSYQQLANKGISCDTTLNGTQVCHMSPDEALSIAQKADSTISFSPRHYTSASVEMPTQDSAKKENGFIIKLSKNQAAPDGKYEKSATYLAFKNCKNTNKVTVKDVVSDDGVKRKSQAQIIGGSQKLPFMMVKNSESKGFALKDVAGDTKTEYLTCFDTPDICMKSDKLKFNKAVKQIPRFENGKLINAYPWETSCPPDTNCVK